MKTVYLWIAYFGTAQGEADPKPWHQIDASLFFSSKEKFKELYVASTRISSLCGATPYAPCRDR